MLKNKTDEMEKEIDTEEVVAVNRVYLKLLEERKNQLMRMMAFIVFITGVFLIALVIINTNNTNTINKLIQLNQDTKKEFIDFLSNSEITKETATTTTTQTTEGEQSHIVNGNQYNDEATHNDGEEKLTEPKINPETKDKTE